MKIIKCFLDFSLNNLEFYSNNILGKILYKDQGNIKKYIYICVGFKKTKKNYTYFSYYDTSSKDQEIINIDSEIIKYNTKEITELAFKDNINFLDIKKDIIDQFNNNDLLIYTYSKIEKCESVYDCYEDGYSILYADDYSNKKTIRIHQENDNNIYNEINYNNVNEMGLLIFNINNELYDLGKTIKLYQTNEDKILNCIILGKNKISSELQKKDKNFNYSIKLETLIDKLIRKQYIKYSLEEFYSINSFSFKCRKGKCSYKKYNKLCNICKNKKNIVEYKICEEFIDKL